MRLAIDFLHPKKFPLTVNQCVSVALGIMTFFLLYRLFIGQSLPLYALALITTAWFIFYYPEVGLLVSTVSVMWFEQLFTLEPIVWNGVVYKLYPLDVILVCTGASILWSWYAGRLPQPQVKKLITRFEWPLIFFGLIVTIGLAAATVKRFNFDIAFGTYKNYFLYSVIYLYAVILFDTPKQWERFMHWFTIGGLGLFVFLGYGLAHGSGLWSESAPLSTSGARLIAGSHAFFFCLFGIWILANWLYRSRYRTKLADYAPLLLAGALLGLSVSLVRHLWLAVIALFIIWAVALAAHERSAFRKLWSRAAIAAGVAALVGVWLTLLISGRLPAQIEKIGRVARERTSIALIVRQRDSSAEWRLAAWRAGLTLFAQNPVAGAGLGAVISGYAGSYQFQVDARELHNNYLGILVQLGLAGILAVAWWWAGLIQALLQTWGRVRVGAGGFLTPFTFTWGSIVALFMMVFSVSVYWDINFFIFWWWLALAAVRFAHKKIYEGLGVGIYL